MGQRFANLGANKPRLNKYGKLDFWLARQQRSWKKHDKPSVCVKLIPVLVIKATLMFAVIQSPTMERESIANMICIAFFYCMRPGEYTDTTTDEQAFALIDIMFYIGLRRLDNESCTDLELKASTQTTYCFTKQKNQHKGDVIAHAASGNMLCCPVKATVRQFMTHRKECHKRNKPYNSKVKLASYYNSKGVNVPVKTHTGYDNYLSSFRSNQIWNGHRSKRICHPLPLRERRYGLALGWLWQFGCQTSQSMVQWLYDGLSPSSGTSYL